jgi:ADP-heptose:LPS heptosyltransferase
MTASDATPTLLALRALTLGDLLVAVPALRALRRAYPQHELVLAAPSWLTPVLPLIGGINRLLDTPGLDAPLPLAGPVDVAVNLHGNGAESRQRLEALRPVHRIGHAAKGWPGPVWDDGLHERERWVSLVRWHGIAADADDFLLGEPAARAPVDGATLVHVGAAHGSRQWPVERFAAVARRLASEGHDVVVTGGAGDRARAEAVVAAAGLPRSASVAGSWELDEFAATVRAARVVVTADTSAAHFATAYRTPSVVLFGPAAPEQWGPPGDGPHVVLTEARMRRGDPFAESPDPALLAVLPGHVLDAVARLESGGGAAGRPGPAGSPHRAG